MQKVINMNVNAILKAYPDIKKKNDGKCKPSQVNCNKEAKSCKRIKIKNPSLPVPSVMHTRSMGKFDEDAKKKANITNSVTVDLDSSTVRNYISNDEPELQPFCHYDALSPVPSDVNEHSFQKMSLHSGKIKTESTSSQKQQSDKKDISKGKIGEQKRMNKMAKKVINKYRKGRE